MKTLSDLLDRSTLREIAEPRFFDRGKEYFSAGCVRGLAEHNGTVTAKVSGTRQYRVKLWVADGEVYYSCTCPVGADGEFCKHCVAVGLAWLSPQKKPADSRGPSVTMKDVQATLAAQSKDALVAMLMERAMEDDALRRKLLLKAAKQGRKKIDLGTYRDAIDEAVDAGGFVDYHEARDYSEGIEESVDSIAELLKEGHAAEVIELSEHALHAVEDALGSVDDSDGYMGGILERLQEIHLAACRKARPDPEELAKRLFQWEISTSWDTFYGAVNTYKNVLGEKGLAVYRRLAQEEWTRVPARKSRDEDGCSRRFRITHIMEELARQTGDVEAVVAVKRRDLSSAYAYLQIAETYKAARKSDAALGWAENGLKAFPNRTDSRLREFAADEYHRRKRHGKAMELIWANFTDQPSLENYKRLKAHADRAKQWPTWRDKALTLLRGKIAKEKAAAQKDRWSWYARTGHTPLVSIYLWEKKIEAAWREAKEGGCTEDLWLRLAGLREQKHPEDALAVYRERIAPTLDQTNDQAYRRAIEFLKKVRALMTGLGKAEKFSTYLASIRADYKRKRNFIKMLDRTGLR